MHVTFHAEYSSARTMSGRAEVLLALRMGWIATDPFQRTSSKTADAAAAAPGDSDADDQIISSPFVRVHDSTLRAFLLELSKRISNQAILNSSLSVFSRPLSHSQRGDRSSDFGPTQWHQTPPCQKNCRFVRASSVFNARFALSKLQLIMMLYLLVHQARIIAL